MNRRGFIGSILALGAAPAIVRAESIMRVVVPTAVDDLFVVTGTTENGIAVAALNINEITREMLRIAHEKAVFIGAWSHLNREPGSYSGAESV